MEGGSSSGDYAGSSSSGSSSGSSSSSGSGPNNNPGNYPDPNKNKKRKEIDDNVEENWELDEDTKEAIDDMRTARRKIGIIMDENTPISKRPMLLRDIKDEFSSYFDEDSGNDNDTREALKEIDGYLKEELKSVPKEALDSVPIKEAEPEPFQHKEVPKHRSQAYLDEINAVWREKKRKMDKGEDPLSDIPSEMPSWMDDID